MIKVVEQYCQQHQLKRNLEALQPKLHKTAWSWCGDYHLAEDLVQDAVAKALKNLANLQQIERFEPWVFKILRNTWMDFCRSKKEQVSIDDVAELVSHDSPESCFAEENMVMKVRCYIAKLPEKQKQVITLVDLAESSYAEVAEILDIPIGTVMSRLCRARKTLAEIIKTEQENTPGLRRVI